MWASIGVGLLLKGLIAALFPVAAGLLYLFFARRDWRRLRPVSGVALLLAIAAPWHMLATLRNPPYFDFTMHSEAGSYRGFFWFYFINEHVLRFLNLRYPRDYNTVPRLYFWAFHLLWLFPWSAYPAGGVAGRFRPVDRAARVRLLALCWIGFILVFFTFSTTQEYYSMPCYPALALLIGAGLARGGKPVLYGTRAIAVIATLAFLAIAGILIAVRNIAAPGDIASALTQNPDSIHAVARPHDRPDAEFVRLSAAAAGGGGRGVPGGRGERVAIAGVAGDSRDCDHDGAVLSRGAAGAGAIRPVSRIAPAGRSSERRAAGQADGRRSVLRVLRRCSFTRIATRCC